MTKSLMLLLLLALILPTFAFADGKVYSKPSIKPPNIPSQRAILTYRDGTETLIIESALDGPGKEFGWIIPLPAPPSQFKPVSPGLIKTFSRTIHPRIITASKLDHSLPIYLSELILIWFLVIFLLKLKPFPSVITTLIIGLLIAVLTVPFSLGRVKSISLGFTTESGFKSGVKVIGQQQIGNYDLTTLQAQKASALDKWLTSNGFIGLDETDTQIVSDYIDADWCFVASKLKRNNDGYSLPHPLSMKFETDQPVYPMRLTATTGSDLYFELFVVAD